MKAKHLKEFLEKLTPEQLNQNVVYNSKDQCISGIIKDAFIQREDLLYTGEDDPAELYTVKQLKEDGYDAEDIEGMDIEIPKGSIVIEF